MLTLKGTLIRFLGPEPDCGGSWSMGKSKLHKRVQHEPIRKWKPTIDLRLVNKLICEPSVAVYKFLFSNSYGPMVG